MRISSLTNNMLVSNLYLNRYTNEYNKSAERIATGKKLASDLVSQIGTLNNLKSHKATAESTIQGLEDAKEFSKMRDAALTSINDLLLKMKEESVSDTANADLISTYATEIGKIVNDTEYKGKKIFSEASAIDLGGVSFAKAALADADFAAVVDGTTVKPDAIEALFTAASTDIGTNGAQSRIVDARLNIETNTLSNIEDSISRIEDVDITEENIKLMRYNTQQILAANMISTMQEHKSQLINLLV